MTEPRIRVESIEVVQVPTCFQVIAAVTGYTGSDPWKSFDRRYDLFFADLEGWVARVSVLRATQIEEGRGLSSESFVGNAYELPTASVPIEPMLILTLLSSGRLEKSRVQPSGVLIAGPILVRREERVTTRVVALEEAGLDRPTAVALAILYHEVRPYPFWERERLASEIVRWKKPRQSVPRGAAFYFPRADVGGPTI